MIEFDHVSFRYARGGDVFRDHSFHLKHGGILAILGPNGRGKTTLLKCILGLLDPSDGRVKVDGETGYVPQQASTLFSYTVLDMVVMGRTRHIGLFSSARREDYRIAEEALQTVGVGGLAERTFMELSGGERQLVLLARAVASDCSLLVLDEPTSALDYRNQRKVLHALERLTRQREITVVFTTHSPNHAAYLADHVLLMQSPDHYRFGKIDEVMTEANLEELYGIEVRNLEYDYSGGRGRAIVPVFHLRPSDEEEYYEQDRSPVFGH